MLSVDPFVAVGLLSKTFLVKVRFTLSAVTVLNRVTVSAIISFDMLFISVQPR